MQRILFATALMFGMMIFTGSRNQSNGNYKECESFKMENSLYSDIIPPVKMPFPLPPIKPALQTNVFWFA